MNREVERILKITGLILAIIVGLALIGVLVGFFGIFFPAIVTLAVLLFIINYFWRTARL